MCSDFTLGPYFNVKRGEPNLEVLITRLLLVVQVCKVKPTYRKSWAKNFDVARFDLGPLLQGQTTIAKLNSADNLLIIVLEVCNMKPTYRRSWAGNLLMFSDLT